MPRTSASLLVLALLTTSVAGAPSTSAAAPADPATVGLFSDPFEEPGARCVKDETKRSICKPAAASSVVLANGKLLYWDALEGSEDTQTGQAAEFGEEAQNDQSRVLTYTGKRRWEVPTPKDGGANPNGYGNPLPGGDNSEKRNDGDMFCSDQVQLADGRVLVAGGTAYYNDPGVPGTDLGAVELEGLPNSRIFNPANNRWDQSGNMNFGRWYPSLVTLGNGKVFVASGVTKLIKPVYPSRPQDSGTNVKQTETYDPRSGKWTRNPASADRSLPLYPRLHLLPNGKVYYDANGQAFNPSGQSYDEAMWNIAATYDPATQRWSDLGVPINGAQAGMRGSTFSIMQPLKAPYTAASFLSAGGVLGPTPGSYVANRSTTMNTVDTAGGKEVFSSKRLGDLNHNRWYSTGVLLPTGQTLAFSGADVDEVVTPGSGAPVQRAELFDPTTGKWSPMATSPIGRTYHNTAVLLPDGRVMVAGHAPINNSYGAPTTTRNKSNGFREPRFEFFSPPYLFAGKRPVITGVDAAVKRGRPLQISVDSADDIASVVLVRNPALTHLVDADQRNVELPFRKVGGKLVAQVPASPNLTPAGPYMLFVNKRTPKGLVPSVSRQVFVGAPAPPAMASDVRTLNEQRVAEELASQTAGSTAAGSTAAGSTAAGSTAAGSTAAGSTSAGSTSAGSTTTGATTTGATGQAPTAGKALTAPSQAATTGEAVPAGEPAVASGPAPITATRRELPLVPPVVAAVLIVVAVGVLTRQRFAVRSRR